MTYRVGPLRASDAGTLGPLHNRLWRETYSGLLPAHVLGARDDADSTRRWFERGVAHERWGVGVEGAITWVARDDDQNPVGWLTVGPGRDARPPVPTEIWSLYVAPERQGKGVARKLLQHLPADRAAYLWVLSGNDRAIAFYRSVGFETDGATKDFEGLDALELRMLRRLSNIAGGRATR